AGAQEMDATREGDRKRRRLVGHRDVGLVDGHATDAEVPHVDGRIKGEGSGRDMCGDGEAHSEDRPVEVERQTRVVVEVSDGASTGRDFKLELLGGERSL